MTAKKTEIVEEKTVQAAGYTKQQLLQSKKYRARRDLLQALLEEGETYTIEQVDRKIQIFMKGKV